PRGAPVPDPGGPPERHAVPSRAHAVLRGERVPGRVALTPDREGLAPDRVRHVLRRAGPGPGRVAPAPMGPAGFPRHGPAIWPHPRTQPSIAVSSPAPSSLIYGRDHRWLG